jgi:hypothetical protein
VAAAQALRCRAPGLPRQRHGAQHRLAIHGQADMDRPVAAPLAIFARAVERIDDPHARLGKARGRIGGFLAQHAIVRPVRRHFGHQESIGQGIALRPQCLAFMRAGRAQVHQDAPGACGQMPRQFQIVHRLPRWPVQITGIHAPITRSTIRSAASSGLSRLVSTRISGFSGRS